MSTLIPPAKHRPGWSRPVRAVATTVLVVLAAILSPKAASAQTPVQDGNSYIGSFTNWEAHIYRIDNQETRCAVRALHPAILDAEIYWVFNTRHFDRLPDGFLALDRRVADGAFEIAVVVDGKDRFALRVGDDGHGYSQGVDAERLIGAMRRGIAMEVVVTRRTTGQQILPVSLLGFTRGSNAARRACAG
jgi:hypothetical protein